MIASNIHEAAVYFTIERKIQLSDATLSELPVQGNFVAGDSEAVIAALEAVLPVQVQRDGTTLLLSRRQ